MSMKTERESLRNLEQKRAEKAWAQVQEIDKLVNQKRDKKIGENYRSHVRKASAMIKMNGLGQTLAFLLSKEEKDAKNAYKQPEKAEGYLYKHLDEWLCGEDTPVAWPTFLKDQPLMNRIMAVDSIIYRQATREALAYLGWLKRFAEARLKKEG